MRGNARKLLQIFNAADRRFIIPVYQRNYEWRLENCAQLYNDLVNVVKGNKESHFFGSIVSYCHSREDIVLVDGQQRVTTISLIFIAMVNAMKEGICVSESPKMCDKIYYQ